MCTFLFTEYDSNSTHCTFNSPDKKDSQMRAILYSKLSSLKIPYTEKFIKNYLLCGILYYKYGILYYKQHNNLIYK